MKKNTKWNNYLKGENYQYYIERVPSELGWFVCELPPTTITRLRGYTEIARGATEAPNRGSIVLPDIDDWFLKNYLRPMCYDYLTQLTAAPGASGLLKNAKKHPFILPKTPLR